MYSLQLLAQNIPLCSKTFHKKQEPLRFGKSNF